MRELDRHAARPQMRTLADLRDRLDLADRDARRIETGDPVIDRPRTEQLVEYRDERVAIGDPVGVGVEARVARQVGPVEDLAGLLPQRVIGDAEREIGILRLENLVGNDGRMLIPAALWPAPRMPVESRLVRQQ